MDILFFDKDRTIGEFGVHGKGIYTGVAEFLHQQRRLDKEIYVATGAPRDELSDLAELGIDETHYLGKEDIFAHCSPLRYYTPSGELRVVAEDYCSRAIFTGGRRIESLSQELYEKRKKALDAEEIMAVEAEIHSFNAYWGTLVHRKTEQPLDCSTTYKNPYLGVSKIKDLYLARLLAAQSMGGKTLRAVMIGDQREKDKENIASDPETPLIVISDRTRGGEWRDVGMIANMLFSQQTQPWEVFESMFSKGNADHQKNSPENRRIVNLEGMAFTLEKGNKNTRYILITN